MAAVTLAPDPYGNDIQSRANFERAKARGRFKLRGWCWSCQKESADARHHIIPLSKGGPNRRLNVVNVVNVCNDCHDEIHPWMKAARQRAVERDIPMMNRIMKEIGED